jgi:cytochrome b6-f complex iron-sulfur subunit
MKRRNFLKIMFGLFGMVSTASFAYPLLRYLAPPEDAIKDKKVVLVKHEISVGTSKTIIFGDKPAIIINRPGKGLIALSRVCTHLGCLVEYEKNANRLLCPCHAGSYDLEGNVLSGPPPSPLQKLPLRIEGDQIVIG